MNRKILITSALPYANGPLHFGHIAGAYLPGDVYARFERLMGQDVLYICGSDEYGVAITLSAEIAGRTPKEQVDIFHHINLNLFKQLNFSFDHYSRTTWEGHKKPVQQFFTDLFENGFIQEKVTEQLYSEKDQQFLADRYVVGKCPRCGFEEARGDECQKCAACYEATDLIGPKSKLSGAPLLLKPTKHWFLRLDLFKEKLLNWIEKKNWKPNVLNFVKNFIEDLHPRAITRDSMWGVPIPLEGTEDKVLYVWFDAPIGYISATQEWALQLGEPERWKEYWMDPKTKLVHFIGKDNIPFHTAIFPAMLMGQNLPYILPEDVPANEFYNLEGRQFSKSDNWTIDLERFFEKYTPDQIRYAIGANAPETSDSEFTWKDFQMRCNSELLGKYGNLVNRTLVFVQNKCGGIVHKPILQEVDEHFLESIKVLVEEIKLSYGEYKLRRAAQQIMELAHLGNVYFDKQEPWKAAKDPEQQDKMHATIYCCIVCLQKLALISSPIIPATAQKVWEMVGQEGELSSLLWDDVVKKEVKVGCALPKPERLFVKIEDEQIQEELDRMGKE